MDGSPRRATQANRQARRQSPYARPTAPPQATPSRLRSVLSYLSPFRSSTKPQSARARDEEDEDEQEDESTAAEDDTDSADEAAQLALHGRRGAWEASHGSGIFNQQPPASPTPVQQLKRALGPTNLSTSFSMPDLASIASPRQPGFPAQSTNAVDSEYSASELGAGGVGGGATEELARFFREKAERGEEGLTAVEQAGVMHLMQHAQSVPTAFTPNFASNLNASFSPAPFGRETANVQAAPSSTYKRRRPLYVGAGYSSRRRKTANSDGGMSKSQSESSLFGLVIGASSTSVVDGKRRRMEEGPLEEDIPVASLDDVLASGPIATTPSPASTSADGGSGTSDESQDKLKSKPSLSRFTGTSTPAKPSPLWQVSKADTPSPSPPRKPSHKGTTGAANLMLDVIQQVNAANPAPKPKVAPGKEAILNPYDTDANPLALASKRVTRSSGAGRSKSSLSRQAPRPKAVEAEKPAEKEISPLEQLERTMPAEYRREATSKRSKPTNSGSSGPPAKQAPTTTAEGERKHKEQKKKPVEVVELLSSDVEEDQLDDHEDEEMAAADVAPPPAPHKKSKNPGPAPTSSTFSAPSPVQSIENPDGAGPGFSFASGSRNPSVPKPSFSLNFEAKDTFLPMSFEQSTPSREKLSQSPAALTPPLSERPSSPKASLPPTPPPVSTPFTFSQAPPTFAPSAAPTPKVADELTTESEFATSSKGAIAALPPSNLPLHAFDFSSAFTRSGASGGAEDASSKAIKDIVRNMGKGELPTFVF
ncbi:hypothetical protein JCM16303_004157 [Sporobolomyces ruberrimus]